MRKEFRDLEDPDVVRDLVRGLDLGGGTERVAPTEARGRVLSERVDAELDVPGFDRATVDGYAVRARDTFGAREGDPATLDLAGTVHAGERPDVTVNPGTVAEVSTGAVLPPGADAVVMVERTARGDDEVEIRTSVAPGDGIMVTGADISAGQRALGPGTRLTPREIALLAALGVEELPVRRGPRVGIVSTGDELVRPGSSLDSDAGQIFDVNSYTLVTSVEEAGGEATLYPHVGDDFEALEGVLEQAARECDLVLSSGSTSAGAVDVIYEIIEEQGELLCHGVAVKPGKPMLVGELGGAAYVGLPGYPVSALMIFKQFVAPAIRAAAGEPTEQTAKVEGRMAVTDRFREGRLRLMPEGLIEDSNGATLVYPAGKGSGATTSLVDADGLVTVPPDVEQLDTGQPVTVELFSPDIRPPSLLGVGEDDPLLAAMLDRLTRPRYLPLGTREGYRRLREGIADVAVAAGPPQPDVETVELGGWTREWGLVVPADNPADVSGVKDLADAELRFVNRDAGSGLRASFDAHLDAVTEDRGLDRQTLVDGIDGYELTANGYESPARRVRAGKADAGLGLRATAATLDLGFVSLGRQQVRVAAAPDRREKAGVRNLETALAAGPELAADIDGFDWGLRSR